MASKSRKLLKVIDGIRSWNVSTTQSKPSTGLSFEIDECLKCEHFQIGKVAIHGFPFRPSCMAFDPVQKIVAIGTKTGIIRILGRPGVDYVVSHPSPSAVVQILFLVNEGGLISICEDDIVHLWNLRQRNPELVHSLQFKREHLTCGHIPVGSSWLYVGTDKGNVHFINVQRFNASGYVINWNKAIEISQSSHPGRIIQIAENPQDSNKLLIGYSTGVLVLWDLRTKSAEARFKHFDNLNGFCWHWDGKSFIACHNFGLLVTWSCKQPERPVSMVCPHAGGESLPEDYTSYESIYSVDWLPNKTGEPFIIFSGGSSSSECATELQSDPTPFGSMDSPTSDSRDPSSGCRSLTIKRGKRSVVLQMDYRLIQFVTLCSSPCVSEFMDPYAVAVLLQDDLVMIDLLSPDYPNFENPYPMDLHIPPVTCCIYVVDCPADLIPALYSVRSRRNRPRAAAASAASNSANVVETNNFSSREWPITGGEWGTSYNAFPEVIATGHADGSVRFWDASQVTLTPLYKIRTLKYFAAGLREGKHPGDGVEPASPTSNEDVNRFFSPNLLLTESDPYAIRMMYFCPESRQLLTASSAHACLLQFSRREQRYSIPVIDVNMAYDCFDDPLGPASADAFTDDQTGFGQIGVITKENVVSINPVPRPSDSASSGQSNSVPDRDLYVFVPIRTGVLLWPPGYQPALICRLGIPAINLDSLCSTGYGPANDPTVVPPMPISAIALNSSYGLLAIGSECGFTLLDYVSQVCLISITTTDLSALCDPPPRVPTRSTGRSSAVPTGDVKPTDQHSCMESVVSCAPPLNMHVNPGMISVQGASISSSERTTVSRSREAVQSGTPLIDEDIDPSSTFCCCVWNSADSNEHKPKPSVADFSSANIPSGRPVNSPLASRQVLASANIGRNIASQESLLRGGLTTKEGAKLHTVYHELPAFTASPVRSSSEVHWPFTVTDLKFDSSGLHNRELLINTVGRTRTVESFRHLRILSPLSAALMRACHAISVFNNLPPNLEEKCAESGLGSQSCSLSASTSSLEQMGIEGVRCVVFADSYPRKCDSTNGPCLWIGTTRGNVIAFSLSTRENRSAHSTTPTLAPIGSLFRLSGEVMLIAFLDMNCETITAPYSKWDDSLSVGDTLRSPGFPTKQSPVAHPNMPDSQELTTTSTGLRQGDSSTAARRLGANSAARSSKEPQVPSPAAHTCSPSTSSPPAASGDVGLPHVSGSTVTSCTTEADRQLLVLCSEKQARVLSLPSQSCLFAIKITETSHVVRASVQRFRPSPSPDACGSTTFLACYLANGHFLAFSLPSLRMLMDVDYLPYTDCVASSFAFGQYGLATYMTSPSELLKITWSADTCLTLKDMQGELFLPCNMPEPPKKGFFKNLLSGNTSSLDRDELFGQAASGKGAPGTSVLLPSLRLDKLGGQASSSASEIGRARNAAIERGEKLQQLDTQTQEMSDQAKGFGRSAALLAAKYERKDKRWGWPL